MARDLDGDLAICEAATQADWYSVAHFIAEARVGWPETIRELQAAEREIDKLRDEINLLQEQLQRRGHTA